LTYAVPGNELRQKPLARFAGGFLPAWMEGKHGASSCAEIRIA